MYADDVIQSLRLTVSAHGSSEVSTDVARQKDGLPQYRVVRETNGRPVLKGRVGPIAFLFMFLLCQPIFASLVIHGFDRGTA